MTRAELKGELLLTSIKKIAPFSALRRECGLEITTHDRVLVLSVRFSMPETNLRQDVTLSFFI